MTVQKRFHLLIRSKAQPGAAQLTGKVLRLEGLVRRHEEQIKVGLLPVAEKQVFADGRAEDSFDLAADLHGICRVMVHSCKHGALGFQRVIDGFLCVAAAILRPAMGHLGNQHGLLPFLGPLIVPQGARKNQTSVEVRFKLS